MKKDRSGLSVSSHAGFTLSRLGKIFSVIGTLIPVIILLGRIIDYRLLINLVPGKLVMNPLSSICFIGMGISIWLVWDENNTLRRRNISRAIALIITSLALAKIIFIIADLNFVLDLLLFKNQLYISGKGENIKWNEMAPNTACCFFLLGLTIFFLDATFFKKRNPFEYLNYIVILSAILSLYGYIYNIKKLYGLFQLVPMTFYTGLCFLFFSVSVLFIRPHKGSMAILVGENPLEVVLLRIAALILPLIFGWLKIEGEKLGLYSLGSGTAFFAFLTFLIAMLLIARKSTIQFKLRNARKEIVEIIRKDNDRLNRIIDISPTYVNIYDLDEERIIYSNNVGLKRLGYKKPIVEMKIFSFIHSYVYKDDRENFINRIRSYPNLKDNEYNEMRYRLVDSNGRIHWLISRATVFSRKENGDVKQVLTNALDITQIKEAEQEILEKNKFIEKITNASPNILYIFDLTVRKLIYANKSIFELLAFPSDKIMSLENEFELYLSLIHPDDYSRVRKYYDDFTFATENEIREIEYRVKDKENKWRWIYLRETPFKHDESNKVTQILGLGQEITARKNAEDELKFRQKQLLEAQEMAHVGSFDWDIVNDVLFFTKETYNLYDFPPEQKHFTKSDFKNRLSEADKEKFEINLSDALNKNVQYEGDYKIILPDGTEKYISIKGNVIKNAQNLPVRLQGTVMDVTYFKVTEEEGKEKNREILAAYNKLAEAQIELKKINAELEERVKIRTNELKESEERYRTFVQQSSEGIWRYELRGIPFVETTLPIEEQINLILKHAYIAETNDTMAKMHGFDSSEQFIGVGLDDFLVSTEENKYALIKNFILSGYRLTGIETTELDKYGNTIYVRSNVLGIIEDNKLLRGWGTQRNITERVVAAQALKLSEEKYKFLAENVPEIFFTSDNEGRVDFYNQKWYNYTGSTYEESKGLGWMLFVHPDDYKQVNDNWNRSVKAGMLFQAEYRLKRADGIYRWHLCRGMPFKDENSHFTKWMRTSTDVHDEKMISEQLQQKNKQLITINADLDNFIYTASHDLKAPIANIEGLLFTLNTIMGTECKGEKDVETVLNMMDSSVNKFKKVILDLTEITKSDSAPEDGSQENLIDEVFQEVIDMIDESLKVSDTLITTDFQTCSYINFPRKNLRSILYNLLSNAIKYRFPNRRPEILVSTKCEDKFTILSVQDNGLGFDTAQIDKAFSMFKKLHTHREGSGIGLYMVKRIITNAGGKIEVESEKGKGSTFRVYIKN